MKMKSEAMCSSESKPIEMKSCFCEIEPIPVLPLYLVTTLTPIEGSTKIEFNNICTGLSKQHKNTLEMAFNNRDYKNELLRVLELYKTIDSKTIEDFKYFIKMLKLFESGDARINDINDIAKFSKVYISYIVPEEKEGDKLRKVILNICEKLCNGSEHEVCENICNRILFLYVLLIFVHSLCFCNDSDELIEEAYEKSFKVIHHSVLGLVAAISLLLLGFLVLPNVNISVRWDDDEKKEIGKEIDLVGYKAISSEEDILLFVEVTSSNAVDDVERYKKFFEKVIDQTSNVIPRNIVALILRDRNCDARNADIYLYRYGTEYIIAVIDMDYSYAISPSHIASILYTALMESMSSYSYGAIPQHFYYG